MTDTPVTPKTLPQTNTLETDIDTAVADGTNAGAQLIDTAVETQAPLFAFPVIKQIFEAFIAWVLGVFSRTGQILITRGINRVEGNSENSSLVDAENALIAAMKTGDQNAITTARANLEKAQSATVNSGGTASPQS